MKLILFAIIFCVLQGCTCRTLPETIKTNDFDEPKEGITLFEIVG